MGAILDYLELIEDSAGDRLEPDTVRWIESSLKVGRSMQALIDNILAYSRLGCIEEMTTVDTGAAFARALENLPASIKESGATVTHGTLAPGLGSEVLLTCLFQNLIGNAIKYRSAAPPRIHVVQIWCERGGKWCFHVSDNGRGFKSEDTLRIFDMFSRGNERDGIAGAGIGLAVCKRIVAAHGGRIWAQPRFPGGAEFKFLLPGGAPQDSRPCPGLE